MNQAQIIKQYVCVRECVRACMHLYSIHLTVAVILCSLENDKKVKKR